MGTETKEVEVRGTFNDFDFLFEGLNPNQPTNIDFDTMEPLIRNVQSWNELRRETVPCPCTAKYYPACGLIGPPITGGVSTQGFTTNHVKHSHTARSRTEIIVPDGQQVEMKYKDIPKPDPSLAPSPDVGVTTALSEENSVLHDVGVQNGAGHCNTDMSSISISTKNGKLLAEKKKLVTRVKETSSKKPHALDCPHVLKSYFLEEERGRLSENTCICSLSMSKVKIHKQLPVPETVNR